MNGQETLEQEIEQPSSSSEQEIEWRRSKVIELASQGLSQREIATTLQVSVGTVNSDIQYLRQKAKVNIKQFIEDELPHQHHLAVTGLNKVIKESWKLFEKEQDSRAKLQALNVISETIMRKQAVLGDPAQIEKAIKLVSKARTQLTNADNEGKKDPEPGSELQCGEVST